MSKRGADEYITKEHGATPNTAEEIKVKMATAAQMAKRKMAAPKSRLNRTAPATSTPSSNPFGSSAFGSSQQQSQQTFGGATNGVTFGQSQSFPPGGSSTGGGFNFAVPTQSTSFTFGQPVQNNPFANLNGTATQEASKPTEDTVMESPQKKPAFATGGFGSTQTSATPGGPGLFGGFGQSASTVQQPPSMTFGQPQSSSFGSGTGLSLFGQSPSTAAAKPEEPSIPSTSIFGQSTAAQPSPSQPATANGLFSESSKQPSLVESNKPTSDVPKSPFALGQSQTQATTIESLKAPTFAFGQPQTQAVPDKTAKAPTFAFGQPARAETKPTTPTFSFGQSTPQSSSVPSTPQPSFANSSFEPSRSSTTSTLFGGAGIAKPIEIAQPAEMASNAATALSKTDPQPSSATIAPISNPFAGLFGQPLKASTGPAGDPPQSLFNFAAPSQPQSIFGAPKGSESASSPDSANQTPSKPLFGVLSGKGINTSSMLSSQSQSSEGATTAPSLLFGSNGTSKSTEAAPAFATPAKTTPTYAFGQVASGKPTAPETPETKAGHVPSGPSTPATIKPLFTSAEQGAPIEGSFTPKSMSLPAASLQQTTGQDDLLTRQEDPRHTIYSNPPARIPPYLSAEKYKSYDSNYRLHSLNREFQKRIAMLDPSREDFENIIRVYVAARESIGESVGLYTRHIAGMKRKSDQKDDDSDGSGPTKRSKPAGPSDRDETPSRNSIGSSIFQPVPSSTKTVSGASATGSSATFGPGNESTTSYSSIFTPSKNVNADKQASISKPASSLFSTSDFAKAGVTQSASPSKSGSLFGSLAGNGITGLKPSASRSTTPPSSPPKKSGFQMPSFGAGAGTGANASHDFMSAFRKQSEASAAKFEKDEMEKRKAEEFDSDDDDEAAWTKKYYEEQQAKKAKIGAFTGFKPSFGSPKAAKSERGGPFPQNEPSVHNDRSDSAEDESTDDGDDGDDSEDADDHEATANEHFAEDEAEDDDDDDNDNEQDSTVGQPLQTNGKSLFDRISRAPDPSEDQTLAIDPLPKVDSRQSLFDSFKATPEAPSFSPITPSTSTPYKPTTTFSFTPTPRESPTPTLGASVFEGGITKVGPIPGEGLFGSRSSTPVDGDNPKGTIFGALGASQNTASGDDHTWKKGSVIKFGSETQAPVVSITAPSPAKDAAKFHALFGTGSAAANDTTASNTLGFGFGASTSTPAPGFLGAVSHLAPGSGVTSGISSRATSPGGTDNESIATNDSEDAQADPQSSLLAHSGPYPGEEDEDILFEARAKVLRNYKEVETEGTKKQKGWNVEGIGPMRVLKNKESGKTRIVVRAEPNANVILNANLTPGIFYKANGSTVVIPVFGSNGPVQWMIKVKTLAIAMELSNVLEENKGS